MKSTEVLADAFGRVPALVRRAVDGADRAMLVRRIDPAANSIAWLAWHLAREQDAQLAPLLEDTEVWVSGGWAQRAALDLPDDDMGYGHTAEQVALVDAPAELLVGYAAAVENSARTLLAGLSDDDLDRVIDENWDPPVTLGVRLVSVVGDALQHAGQAAFLRGVFDRTVH